MNRVIPLLVLFFCILITSVLAENISLEIVKQIESSGDPKAISPDNCIGLYQISIITLKDYNNFHTKEYSKKDLFNGSINKKIAKWYLFKRIPQLLQHFNKPVTTKNILWAYNSGIKRVIDNYMPEETKEYIKKYGRLRGGFSEGPAPNVREKR